MTQNDMSRTEETHNAAGEAETSPTQPIVSEQEIEITIVRTEDLVDMGKCEVFEKAADRVRADLEENPMDPFYAGDWGFLANQVVGQERFEHAETASAT